MNKILTLIIPLIIALITGCNLLTGPEVTKDPRKYTWSVDTLMYPESYQTMMVCIWGNSPKDVYAAGHNDHGYGNMYHFDGSTWNEVMDFKIFPGYCDISDITGFNNRDIWVCGIKNTQNWYTDGNGGQIYIDTYSSQLSHYDGSTWSDIKLENGRPLQSIWGSSPNNIYTVGMNQIWHYDGISWSMDSLPGNTAWSNNFYLRGITGNSSGEVFTLGEFDQEEFYRFNYYFFRKKNNKWELLDSSIDDNSKFELKWGYNSQWVSREGNLYSAGAAIFLYKDNKWQEIFNSRPHNIVKIFGTSDNNIFAVGDYGIVYHYNGNDWHLFTGFQGMVTYCDGWTDGNEVFITGFTLSSPNKTVILHGK